MISGATSTLDHWAKTLCRTPLIVFAGAGVSFESGLPLVGELTRAIMDALDMTPTEQDAIGAARLPFERFIETLAQISDADELYRVFEGGEPNAAHFVCAELLSRGLGRAVVTTNFDLLFESAIADTGVKVEKHWRDVDLGTVNWLAPTPKLLKIHGSIEDVESLAITIRRVASQQTMEARSVLLSQVFDRAIAPKVIVLGYSGSDHFDINPALRALKRPAADVVLVSHDPSIGGVIEAAQLNGHPRAGVFDRFDGTLLRCDTTRLWAASAQELGVPNLAPPRNKPDWSVRVESWNVTARSDHGRDWTNLAAGFLLSAAHSPDAANARLKRAADGDASPLVRYRAKQKASDNYRDSNRAALAKAELKVAVRIARAIDSHEHLARCLLNWGVLRADEKAFRHAIRCYDRAARLARACGATEIVMTCLGNKAIALKNIGGAENLDEAQRLGEETLCLAADLGDKRTEGRTLGNLGILHSVRGDTDLAVSYYARARQLAVDLGDTIHVAIWSANEGKDRLANDPEAASVLIEEAAQLFESIGSLAFAERCRSWLNETDSA